ncbi:uncharacterized protein K444DRAFT_421193 [Hyaloscypha bicolor E]|uniref:Uncharacterized protein n=1 Tax=Hyaloscypha bicolor E TaxID=1095630 RepID=A0A2J6T7M2_9HELO|nr:uncharacterized protein K444DRAFT_421193 [Hyaloscypha bicolor E]PMD59015.1 hypothetical protein K444DRAFT_421193 [Hyaloscypha bicolor E]
MTLRLGYKFCVEHINELAIKERLETDSMTSNTLFIFYKVARTSSNEIEQLAAWTSTREHFSTFANAPTEVARTSPILRKFSPPAIYTLASRIIASLSSPNFFSAATISSGTVVPFDIPLPHLR